MAKKPIEQMTYEELRAEVALMRDDMARMKRTYEDLLYNLDMDNFSGQFVKEANGFKSSVSQTAEEIRAEAQKSAEALDGKIQENSTLILQTATDIRLEAQKSAEALDGKIQENAANIDVNADAITAEATAREQGDNGLNEQISTVAQTAEGIKAEVATVKNGVETNKASIKANAEAIKSKVEQKDIDDAVADLSSVTQTAEAIKSMVLKRLDMKSAVKVTDAIPDDADEKKVYCVQEPLIVGGVEITDDEGNIIPASESYYYYNTVLEEWTELDSDSIYTVFEQTADGFRMRGNVVIDGNLVVGLAKVAETLYIGDINDVSDKEIVFCNMARIRCVQDGMDISIVGRELYIGTQSLNLSNCQIVWGDNQPVCKFGTDE